VRGDRKLHNEELLNFYSSQDIMRMMISRNWDIGNTVQHCEPQIQMIRVVTLRLLGFYYWEENLCYPADMKASSRLGPHTKANKNSAPAGN
jgi:hypothetical protein